MLDTPENRKAARPKPGDEPAKSSPDKALTACLLKTKAMLPDGWSVVAEKDVITVRRDEKVEADYSSPVGMSPERISTSDVIQIRVGPRISAELYAQMAAENMKVRQELLAKHPNYDPVDNPISRRLPHVLPTHFDGQHSFWISSKLLNGGFIEFKSKEVFDECSRAYAGVEGLFYRHEEAKAGAAKDRLLLGVIALRNAEELVAAIQKRLPANWQVVTQRVVDWSAGGAAKPRGRGVEIVIQRQGFQPLDLKYGRGGQVVLALLERGYTAPNPETARAAQAGNAQYLGPWRYPGVFGMVSGGNDWATARADIQAAMKASKLSQPPSAGSIRVSEVQGFATKLSGIMPANWEVASIEHRETGGPGWPKGDAIMIGLQRKGITAAERAGRRGGTLTLAVMLGPFTPAEPVGHDQVMAARQWGACEGHAVFAVFGDQQDWPNMEKDVRGLLEAAAPAEDLPTCPIRSLVIQSATTVLAEPAEPAKLEGNEQTFKVIEVLKGPAIKAGTTIVVRRMDLYQVGRPAWRQGQPEAKPPRIVRAILFLTRPEGADAKPGVFDLLLSGMRCLDAEKNVLRPEQLMNPGGLYLIPEKGADWDKLIARVRSDLPKVAEALALKEIPDLAERNQAIFAWIEKHRGEFTGRLFTPVAGETGDKPGWAELEWEPFNWIMETCRADDGWRALKLAREIAGQSGPGPSTNTPTFASPAGRKLLLGVILDPKQPVADRKMALYRLRGSCWARWQQQQHPNLADITPDEQAGIIREISPLLKDPDREIRGLAAKALADASSPCDGNMRDRDTDAALPVLIEAYAKEPPGNERNEMAQIVLRLGKEDVWQRISGNPDGLLVVLHSFNRNTNYGRETIAFQANSLGLGTKTITEQPTLVMERLGDDNEAKERRSMPLPVSYPKDIWKQGWSNHQGVISVEVPAASLAEGQWRFSVEGVVGKEDVRKWHSEPAILELKRGK